MRTTFSCPSTGKAVTVDHDEDTCSVKFSTDADCFDTKAWVRDANHDAEREIEECAGFDRESFERFLEDALEVDTTELEWV